MKRALLVCIPVLVLIAVAWNSRPASRDAAPKKTRVRSAPGTSRESIPDPEEATAQAPEKKLKAIQHQAAPLDVPSDNVVHVALRWLLNQQTRAGCWASGVASVDGHVVDEVGETALALLSLLGAGYSHLSKDEIGGHDVGKKISAALEWLMKRQQENGVFLTNGDGPMTQALAALAISEVYGITGNQKFAGAAERAVAALGLIQAGDGSWGTPSRDSWAAAALKSAQVSDVALDAAVVDRSKARVEAGMGPAADARLVVENIWFNRRKSDAMAAACAVLVERPMDAARPNLGEWYFTSLALFQYDGPGGDLWKKWNVGFRDALMAVPGREGAVVSPNEVQSVVDTALLTLCFEVYYRYAPIGR